MTYHEFRYTSPYSQGRAALICRASKVPAIKLNFQTVEGPTTVECESGDILRDVMLDQKVDLYTTWGKVWTCGGNGQCGTCVVKVYAQLPSDQLDCTTRLRCKQIAARTYAALPIQVIDGSNLLSERNSTEEKKLKKVSHNCLPCLCLNTGANCSRHPE